MIELAFIACLRLDPTACEPMVLPLFSGVSITQCTIGAQPVLAQWCGDHPLYRIAGWACRPPGAALGKA